MAASGYCAGACGFIVVFTAADEYNRRLHIDAELVIGVDHFDKT